MTTRLRRFALPGLALGLALAMSGCATTYDGDPYYRSSSAYQYDRRDVGAQGVSYGEVESVRAVALQRHRGPGAGAVIGAIVGGVIGNQFGGGSGRDLATIGGAVAGGAIGHQVQRSNAYENGLEIVVRLDYGGRVAVVQNQDYSFRPGQRVKVVGTGDRARVAPAY